MLFTPGIFCSKMTNLFTKTLIRISNEFFIITVLSQFENLL